MGGGRQWRHAWLEHAFAFEITEDAFGQYSLNRNAKNGVIPVYPDLKIEKCERKVEEEKEIVIISSES